MFKEEYGWRTVLGVVLITFAVLGFIVGTVVHAKSWVKLLIAVAVAVMVFGGIALMRSEEK